jgi:hypothetical protein
MGTKTRRHIRLALCVLFFVTASQAYGGVLMGPVDISIFPPNPTSQDTIAITVSGEWSDSCIPNASYVWASGNDVFFEVSYYGPPNCLQIPMGWQQINYVGPLSPGVYTLHVNITGFPPYSQTTQFTVSGPAERNVPSQYSTIQAAINAAGVSDVVIVAPGTYTGDGNRDIDFLGKTITVRSTDPNDPCIVAATIIDCQGTNHRGFKFVSNEGRATILEGLTITDANIAVMCEGGAGIYIDGASPTINKCVVTNNHAQLVPESLCFCYGGGIFIGSGSNPLITNCIISGNSVGNWGLGGGICGYYSAQATIHNCLINNNTALGYEGMGGGIYSDTYGLTVTNCTIANNSTTNNGSGVCGFATIKDSVIWSNTGINQIAGSPNITYSDIQGGFAGTGNINADPCFVTGPLGDYCLSQTNAGQATNSPCINAGSDTAENLNMNSLTTRTDMMSDAGIVDMGYHYPTFIVVLDSDIDGNFFVDFFDYALMSRNWQQSPDPCDPNSGDIIKNGIVDIQDLAEFCADWLTCYVTQAATPQPADQIFGVSTHAILRWLPGEHSISHDVYFGTDFNAIDTADTASSGVYMGNQDVNFWNSNNYKPFHNLSIYRF